MASELSGGGLIPPPPGVEPNLIDPLAKFRTTLPCPTFVTFFVIIQIHTRICITKTKLWIESVSAYMRRTRHTFCSGANIDDFMSQVYVSYHT